MMFFRILILYICLCLPAAMVVFGLLWWKKPPESDNAIFRYRSSMSRKNRETWRFAHVACGRYWCAVGPILACISVAALLPLWEKKAGLLILAGGAMVVLQTVAIILTFLPVEKALKREFDQRGCRKGSVSQ